MAGKLDTASAFVRPAAITTSAWTAVATLEEHSKVRVKPSVLQLRALCKPVKTTDARLTVVENPLERNLGQASLASASTSWNRTHTFASRFARPGHLAKEGRYNTRHCFVHDEIRRSS